MIGTLQELLLLAFAGASLNMLQWSAMRSDINFSFRVSTCACFRVWGMRQVSLGLEADSECLSKLGL